MTNVTALTVTRSKQVDEHAAISDKIKQLPATEVQVVDDTAFTEAYEAFTHLTELADSLAAEVKEEVASEAAPEDVIN